MEDGVVIQVFLRHHRLDDVLHQVLVDFVIGHICRGKGRKASEGWGGGGRSTAPAGPAL